MAICSPCFCRPLWVRSDFPWGTSYTRTPPVADLRARSQPFSPTSNTPLPLRQPFASPSLVLFWTFARRLPGLFLNLRQPSAWPCPDPLPDIQQIGLPVPSAWISGTVFPHFGRFPCRISTQPPAECIFLGYPVVAPACFAQGQTCGGGPCASEGTVGHICVQGPGPLVRPCTSAIALSGSPPVPAPLWPPLVGYPANRPPIAFR